MAKRAKMEIIRDILQVIKDSNNSIKITPLLRRSNISSLRFREYYSELIEKGLLKEADGKGGKYATLTEKGFRFLEKYRAIVDFIDEFGL